MTTRTVSLRHHGNRVVGPVETTDAAYCRDLGTVGHRPRNVRDAVLEAIGPGNILRLGHSWEGGERARLDLTAVEIAKLATPLTDPRIGGRKLTAEPAPGELDLGLVFDGLEAIRRAEEAGSAEMRDTLRRQGLEMLERAVRDAKERIAKAGTTDGASNCFTRSRAAMDAAFASIAAGEAAIAPKRLGGSATADSGIVTPSTMTNADLNQLHAEFWARQAGR